jgi:hypothetical protein
VASGRADETDEWGVILEERFAMCRQLREETLRQGLPAGDEEFYAAYGKLVELVKARVLGGGRFAAEKPNTLSRLPDLYSSVTAIPES